MIGIWMWWPGTWVKDAAGQPRAFDTEAEAQAWAEEEGYIPDLIEFLPL